MTIDPTIYAATLIAAMLATLVSQRLLDYMRRKDMSVSLELKNKSLESANSALQKNVGDLEAQIKKITERLAEHESREAVLAKYTFEERIGGYRLNDLHFCPRCLHDTPQKQTPMKNRGDGWQCTVCTLFLGSPT